jgi:hypothetical protein
MTTYDRALPHNPDAERAVLGAILLDGGAVTNALRTALEHVTCGDFFVDCHRAIFRQMVAMAEAGQAIDLVTLCDELDRHGDLEVAGGPAYCAALADGVPRVSNVPHYCKILREKTLLRTFVHAGQEITHAALGRDASIESITARVRELSSLTPPAEQTNALRVLSAYDCAEFLKERFTDAEDHLVGTLVPRGGAVLLYGLPKGLKSWIALGMALDAACGRRALGMFPVKFPVRTLFCQVEDRPSELQKRLFDLISSNSEMGPEPRMLRIVPRCPMNLFDANWRTELRTAIERQQSDLVVLDVLRRLFRGDVSSSQDTANFLEILDSIRDTYKCAVLLVHHSKKARTGEMQTHAMGSTNLAAWGDVLLQVKNKEVCGSTTTAELEIEAKSEVTPEPVSIVLDPMARPMLVARTSCGGSDLSKAKVGLGSTWTSADLERVLGISAPTASRRVGAWLSEGLISRIDRRGRGLAMYTFTGLNTQIQEAENAHP